MAHDLSEFERCLSKTLVIALRHAPDTWGIELDHQGWTNVRALIEILGLADSRLAFVRERHLRRLVRIQSSRFELHGDKIRALYGHSVSLDCGADELPPEYLLHTTTTAAWAGIQLDGLTRQGRSFVHLTTDRSYANLIGEKHGANRLLVVVAAALAHLHGQRFWRANESIWLTERISPVYLRLDLQSAMDNAMHPDGFSRSDE